MARLQALLRSRATAERTDVDTIISEVNRLMTDSTDGSRFVTLFFAIYDDDTRTMRYVNAGHNLPFLLRAASASSGWQGWHPQSPNRSRPINGSDRLDIDIRALDTTGTVIGLFPDSPYRTETVQLNQGDLLIIYTDGIIDARNGRDEEFGEGRLIQLAHRNSGSPASDLRDLIMSEITAFCGTQPQFDDMTLVVAKVI